MTHMYFSPRAEGRISYGHLGRTNSCYKKFLEVIHNLNGPSMPTKPKAERLFLKVANWNSSQNKVNKVTYEKIFKNSKKRKKSLLRFNF